MAGRRYSAGFFAHRVPSSVQEQVARGGGLARFGRCCAMRLGHAGDGDRRRARLKELEAARKTSFVLASTRSRRPGRGAGAEAPIADTATIATLSDKHEMAEVRRAVHELSRRLHGARRACERGVPSAGASTPTARSGER